MKFTVSIERVVEKDNARNFTRTESTSELVEGEDVLQVADKALRGLVRDDVDVPAVLASVRSLHIYQLM